MIIFLMWTVEKVKQSECIFIIYQIFDDLFFIQISNYSSLKYISLKIKSCQPLRRHEQHFLTTSCICSSPPSSSTSTWVWRTGHTSPRSSASQILKSKRGFKTEGANVTFRIGDPLQLIFKVDTFFEIVVTLHGPWGSCNQVFDF